MSATKTKPEPAAKSAVHASVKRVSVTLKSVPPGVLYQGKGVMEADGDGQGAKGKGKTVKHRPASEEADMRAHWIGTGAKRELCIPWVMLYQSFCKASSSFKFRGKMMMSAVIPSTISCEVSRIPLGTAEFEVFEEYCRIPPYKGQMVKIGRALLREWKASFVMVVDDEMYQAEVLREIIQHAGKMVGIGAWRPQLKGPYGRFTVEGFEIL